MGKDNDVLEAVNHQNKLLQEQNALLREQNELLRQSTTISKDSNREIFIENIDRDEIRSGFLVTSHRKKLWNAQIGLINEFARICQKHNLRWFAIGGTLLGAVRHKGFIPWDDDVDVMMLRPEYEKFQQIVFNEVREPYFVDVWYNYRLESEGASLEDDEGSFQFITEKQLKVYGENRWFTQWPSIRIRDNRTTMVEMPDRKFTNQSVWLDIFPYDPVPPFTSKKQKLFFEYAKLLLLGVLIPSWVRKAIDSKKNLVMNYDSLEKFLSESYRKRGKIFDNFMNKNFFLSERIGDLHTWCLTPGKYFRQSKDFADVTYLPFEKIEVPAPIGYESVLTDSYGDWRKPVYTHRHSQSYTTDIPWDEYIQKIAFN